MVPEMNAATFVFVVILYAWGGIALLSFSAVGVFISLVLRDMIVNGAKRLE